MTVRWIGLALLCLAGAVNAQTRYVSDRAIVELRRGPSTEYLILRNLEAGEAVQVLEQDDAAGYSRVKVLDQGTEGWILTRFLTAEPIARDRLATAERTLASARSRVAELERQMTSLSTDLATAQAELDNTRASHTQVSQELNEIRTSAANVVQITEQNESLRQRLIQRDREVEELTAANADLAGKSSQSWFVVGAAVLFGGVVIGLIAPSLRRKRRSDW
jgi:SH3 domain protein